MARRRGFTASVVVGLLLLCTVYCFVAPKQYEACATVALRQGAASSLNMEAPEPIAIASLLSAPLQLETLADVLRSDRLAWRVMTGLKLYQEPGFMGSFAQKFRGFHAETPGVEGQAYLLERFHKRLCVQSVPRTLLIAIRFRSRDAALSAAAVNALIRDYLEQESDSRIEATVKASDWLESQLKDLKEQMDRQNERLISFQTAHGILGTTGTQANGQQPEAQYSSLLLEIDELDRQLPYYRTMDLMVLPTRREGFPNVVLEAAATGIPVITIIATGSRDSVVPEVTGLLIPPGHPEAISEAVLSLLRNPERRRRMGEAARAWVVEHFANQRVLGLITAFYKGLLAPASQQNLASIVTDLAAEPR